MDSRFLSLPNPGSAELKEIPAHTPEEFAEAVDTALELGSRLVCLCGVPHKGGENRTSVLCLLADDASGLVHLLLMNPAKAFPSLTPRHPSAHAFERALWEDQGIRPEGHPWLKPLRREVPGVNPEEGNFFTLEGEEVHEVAVGPVHAGIIEPGHFRFMCHGETVHHLEIRLGYQHRGARKLLTGYPNPGWVPVAESITGDTAVGAAWAHALCMEELAGVSAAEGAEKVRALALELERIAYHVGDLGALGNDVGFLPTAQFNGRIRGDFLNCLLTLSGNRHGRGLIRPGGVLGGLADPSALRERIERHHDEARRSVKLLLNSPTVLARFDQTGTLGPKDAAALGIVGVAARASGLPRDVRISHSHGYYRVQGIETYLAKKGDVRGRALVRSHELDSSAQFAADLLKDFPRNDLMRRCSPPRPGRVAFALVEAWRGELVHVRVTDEEGRVCAAEVVDPSVHNWFGLAHALRGQGISDFPLCNKSFNLAYAGHDL